MFFSFCWPFWTTVHFGIGILGHKIICFSIFDTKTTLILIFKIVSCRFTSQIPQGEQCSEALHQVQIWVDQNLSYSGQLLHSGHPVAELHVNTSGKHGISCPNTKVLGQLIQCVGTVCGQKFRKI